MSMEITRSESLAAICRPPRMSASLTYYAGGASVIDGTLFEPQGTPGPADVAEAVRHLPELEYLCRPPTAALVSEWCKRLVPHLPRAPAGPDELRRVVDGVMLGCYDIPFAAWTVESAAAALKVLEWWPPPAKVHAILEPFARRLLRQRDGVERVAATGAPPPLVARGVPPPEALGYVSAIVSEFAAERSFNDDELAPPPPKARPLSAGNLLAEYDRIAREGGPFAQACSTRARAIRESLRKQSN